MDLSLSAALGTGKISNVDFATSKLNKVKNEQKEFKNVRLFRVTISNNAY